MSPEVEKKPAGIVKSTVVPGRASYAAVPNKDALEAGRASHVARDVEAVRVAHEEIEADIVLQGTATAFLELDELDGPVGVAEDLVDPPRM